MPSFPPSILKIYVNYSVSGNMLVKRTNSSTTVTETFAVTANTAQIVSVMTDAGDTFNIQFSVTGTLTKLAIHEVIPQS